MKKIFWYGLGFLVSFGFWHFALAMNDAESYNHALHIYNQCKAWNNSVCPEKPKKADYGIKD